MTSATPWGGRSACGVWPGRPTRAPSLAAGVQWPLLLSSEAKAKFASELTKFHSAYAGVPGNWVHVVFQDYAPGSGFSAGRASAAAALTLLIRSGRSPDYKRGLLKRLLELFQDATRAPDDQITIGIQEVPPSQAMEMAQIMPDVSQQ